MNFLAALILFAIIITGMAIGLIIAKKPLQKGCSSTPDETCPICQRKPGDPCADTSSETSKN